MAQKKLPVNIYKYTDYRLFLEDLFNAWGKLIYKWSYGKFSKEAGFAVSNYLKLIISGKKNLGKTGIEKIVRYFQFNKGESLFFKSLVGFCQAKNDFEKDKFYKEIKSHYEYSKYNKRSRDIHRFYSKWYNPVIRELVDVENFQNDPKWISQKLFPKISETEAERSLRFLLESGQLTTDNKGRIKQSESIMSTGESVASLSVTNYHQEMIKKAKESLKNCSQDERNISSLTMAVTSEVYKKIVKEIYSFQGEIIKLVTSEENKLPEEVCQLNFQLFPVTKRKNDKRRSDE